MTRNRLLSLGVLALSVTALAGCSATAAGTEASPTTGTTSETSPSADAGALPADPKPIVFYTSRSEDQVTQTIADFVSLHPQYEGKITYLVVPTQEALERVKAESANPQADFLWGGTRQQLTIGAQDDIFAPLPDAVREAVPADYQDAEGRWVGEQILPEVIFYNKDVLDADAAPKDWSDLVSEKYAGQIGIRDVAASGTMRTIWDALIQTETAKTGSIDGAWKFLTQLDANTVAYPSSADLNPLMQRQQYSVSAWNLQSLLIDINRNGLDFIQPVVPTSGAVYLVDGIAKIADNPAGADVDPFLEFIFSQDVQAGYAEDYFQISTQELQSEPQWLTDLNLHELKLDWDDAIAHEAEWIQYWQDNIKTQK
jgi:iron(III) transport system substrate-binding protein